MKITDEIVKAYINGDSINKYKEMWYFKRSRVAGDAGRNIFTEPEYSEEQRKKVDEVYQAILKTVKNFKPLNQPIFDALFPTWKETLSNINVDLIIGFPDPYDATVEMDDQGVSHIIFDLGMWSRYLDKCDIREVAMDLVTHEFCHIVLESLMPQVVEDEECEEYLRVLDAVTFDEAFAHLVSYESKEIGQVDWQAASLQEVREKSNQEMRNALAAVTKDEQKDYLYRANCGTFYEKYACMSGMLYLAQVWMTGGAAALKDEFLQGHQGFADRCSRTQE